MGSVYDLSSDDSDLLGGIDLAQAVRQLPERQQVILALRCSNYTQQSITELLGISRTTVWSDEKEALAKLREILSKSIEGSGGFSHA